MDTWRGSWGNSWLESWYREAIVLQFPRPPQTLIVGKGQADITLGKGDADLVLQDQGKRDIRIG